MIELSGDRVAGNSSIVAFSDGGFYDHNGGRYYRNEATLLKAEPALPVNSSKIKPSIKKSTHKPTEVTKTARYFKETFTELALKKYLPFHSFIRIISNVGTTTGGDLVVQWFKPTLGGAKIGEHFSLCQVRGTNPKWRSIKGSDAKTVEAGISSDEPVYCVFGAGDFLLLKSMGVNYLAFGGDAAVKNSQHAEYIKNKVGNRTVRVVADNDPSGRSVILELKKMGLEVRMFDWRRIKVAKDKFDLRDLGWEIQKLGGKMQDLIKVITTKENYVR